jgi:acyl-CoA synthetase (AMP-forming)/AMP-acid ligase II
VFEGVSSYFEVKVNGEYVGMSKGSHLQSEFDITSYLTEGDNTLTVTVYKWCDGSYLEDQDFLRFSGIFRDVYLLERPVSHISDFFIHTSKEGGVLVDFNFCGPVLPVKMTILDPDGNKCATGDTGEICIRTKENVPCGLFIGYYLDEEKTKDVWHDGYYHTGDTATMDEDGYLWYVGRIDDVIKSSGYRIGPFEIESVIMELPYVLECAITPVPDEVRGQIVKATIVLVKGKNGTDELKKEIQEYVKTHTAPYKYPRIVEFVDELPKTISGKVRRVEIRKNDLEKMNNK